MPASPQFATSFFSPKVPLAIFEASNHGSSTNTSRRNYEKIMKIKHAAHFDMLCAR
jgi:hypothetical protein